MGDNTKQTFETWAMIELFGHQQLAGLVTEASIGGCSFIRVNVPEINGRPAFTKFYGNGAIYSMTPVGEQEARMALERIIADEDDEDDGRDGDPELSRGPRGF